MEALLFTLFISVLAGLLFALYNEEKWREQSWEGVVISKYEDVDGEGTSYVVIELCHNQTVQTNSDLDKETWQSIEIGNYIIKKSGRVAPQ